MRIMLLTSDEDLESYRQLTEKYINVLLPLEYLQRSKVVAFRHANGELCGGYVLVQSGPLRVLESIPEDDFSQIFTDLSNVAEITGLWLDSKKSGTLFCSVALWLRLYFDLLFSSFDGFVYAYTLKKNNLLEWIRVPVKEVEAVEFVPKRQAILAPFRHHKFLTRRVTIVLRSLYVTVVRKCRRLLTSSS